MDPQREFIRYNSKIIKHMRFRTLFLRFRENVDMKDFCKPTRYLIIYTGHKYKKILMSEYFV